MSKPADLVALREIERKLLWLSAWIIHNANHIRPSDDGLKVGGHQASSASLVTIMTALYFAVLRPEDRVAVKPHASPVLHAIEYLFGRQSVEQLERFRGFGGAQSYPSRTKDKIRVDFSTGSVGLGAAITNFASLVQDYVALKGLADPPSRPGRMIALVGDAELDEGNIYEALLESWKHDIRNTWWIIDYNRQSLDAIVEDRLFGRFDALFSNIGWEVVTLKYGKRLEHAFAQPDGEHLRAWIDNCPNSLYAALTYKGGAAWREALLRDVGDKPGIRRMLEQHDDEALGALMTNLAGHDLETLLEAFMSVQDDRSRCFIAYTIKGFGLPFAGHKDNHAGLMNPEQMALFRRRNTIPDGAEWDMFAGINIDSQAFTAAIRSAPYAAAAKPNFHPDPIPVPAMLDVEIGERMSTQEGFGRILANLGRGQDELSSRIVTMSPDVTVSTNLGGWVNRRGIFDRRERADTFRSEKVVSAQSWSMSPQGQHVELGIAENNLFLMLAATGLSHSLFGTRLLPIGTLYDPFIQRGLDALNYACYQDARFILVATPSGLTLAPEGGAHQSIATPLIGMGQPGLTYFEPAYVDELAVQMAWALEHIQQEESGGSVYFRLSTRSLPQRRRAMTEDLRADILAGAYWLIEPGDPAELIIICCGAVMPEVLAAYEEMKDEVPGLGVLAVTSPDLLFRDWRKAQSRRSGISHIERLLARSRSGAGLVTVADGHPATLSWLGSISGGRIKTLGVDRFGQSGNIAELYGAYGLDTGAIVEACADMLVAAWAA